MKQAHITDQASNIASTVTDTVADAVSTGVDRGRDLVATAVDRLPDSSAAADWTRQHVPGLTPPKKAGRSWLPLIGAILAVGALVWWLRRDTESDTR